LHSLRLPPGWYRGRLSRKLITSTLLMIVLFLSVQGYLCYRIGKQALIREILSTNLKLATTTARNINAEYEEMVYEIHNMYSTILKFGKDPAEKVERLLGFRLEDPVKYKALYLLDRRGTPLLSLDDPYVDLLGIDDAASLLRRRPSEPPQEVLAAYERAARGGGIFFSEATFTGLDRTPKLHVGIPILYGDEQEGQYLVVVIDLSYLWGSEDEIYLGKTGRAFLVNRKGLVIAHPDTGYLGLKVPPDLSHVLEGYEGQAQYVDPVSQEEMLATYTPVGKQSGWGIVVEQSKAETLGPINRIAATTFYYVLGSCLLAFLVISYFMRRITHPIERLTTVAARVEQQELFSPEELRDIADGRDEIARLARVFTGMVTSLKEAIEMRDKTLDSLRESEEKYRLMVEEIKDVIYISDQSGVLTYISPVVESVTGFKPSELIGKHYSKLVHEEDLQALKSHFKDALSGKYEPIDYRILTKSGDYRWITASNKPIYEGDRVVGMRGSFTDITESRRLQDQLAMAQKMESIGTLAGGIAHDFNNLLTTILGNADILLMEIDRSTPLYEGIRDIKEAGTKASSLTRQLLTFSRKDVIHPAVLNLNEVLAELGKMLKRLIREDVELSIATERDLWDVYIDPTQLEQVIINLAVNARDAMPQGGKLIFEAKNVELDEEYFRSHGLEGTPGPHVLLAISDTGVGMDEATRARIFEPFFTTKEMGKGTGLGLATVYGIVKQNNGFIWVYSEPGKGTTFKVYFPKWDKGRSSTTRLGSLDRAELRGSETILIVEDDPMLLKVAGNMLRQYGYDTIEVGDSKEALRIAEESAESIDLLLTDVIMPGMGGSDLAERVKLSRPDIKVIYMSGYTDNTIVHNGVLEKDVFLVEKPFTPETLVKKIREVLDQ